MHYYKRNLGDYAKKAGRLNIFQHGVYNLLLDACYDREEFPTRDQAIEWVWAESEKEIAAVDFVLSRLFQKPDEHGRYVQTRVLEEILQYHEFCDKQAVKGKSGGRPKKAETKLDKPAGLPAESQEEPGESLTTNQEPLTNNHVVPAEPKRKRFTPPTFQEVQDYCLERRNQVEPNRFIDFYSAKGWKVGNSPMKDWKACVRTWESREATSQKTGTVIEHMTDKSWAN